LFFTPIHWSTHRMLVLMGLAEDVKLSAYGRQPTTFLSFSFCLYLFIFIFILFSYWHFSCYFSWCLFLLYGWSSALLFKTCNFASKFWRVLSPYHFLSTRYCISIYTLGIMYHLLASLKFWTHDHFIRESKSWHLPLTHEITYVLLWICHKHISTQLWGMTCKFDCVCF
jgi:hypothetical protein